MAYKGYLIKILDSNYGDYEIDPEKYIQADSYLPYISVLDLDSTRNALGELIRNPLDHTPAKIDFTTPPSMTNTDYALFMSEIRKRYVIAKERKCKVNFYVPELDDYETQYMYMPDPQPKIYRISEKNIIYYEAIRVAFIGY